MFKTQNMSSKQQYKEYSTRLKAEIRTLKEENEQLQKQVFRLKMQPKELNMPVVTTSFNFKNFMLGFMVGGVFCLIILYLSL